MENSLDTFQILIGLFGGLALFLFGMEQMTDALKLLAGGGMKRLLARLTTNRFSAAFAGAFVSRPRSLNTSSVYITFPGALQRLWQRQKWQD